MPASVVRVERTLLRVNLWMARLGGVAILGITAFTLYGVFTRYGLRDPDTWSYPVSSYLLLFVAFLATARAHEDGDHVSVDLVLQRLPRRARRVLETVGDIAALLVLAVFLQQVSRLFLASLSRGRTDETMLAWPLAAVQWVMPLGAAMLLLTHVVKMRRRHAAPRRDARRDG